MVENNILTNPQGWWRSGGNQTATQENAWLVQNRRLRSECGTQPSPCGKEKDEKNKKTQGVLEKR